MHVYITLNRPKVLNALNHQTWDDLRTAFEAVRDDGEARGVILTGAGDKAFIAGADINELAHFTAVEAEEASAGGQAVLNLVENLGKPVIAAINGHAIAGGCVLACAADCRLMAAQSGRIGVPELLVGVPFPTIALEIMRSITAPQQFPAVLYGGATFDPAQALERGLVDALVAPDTLIEQALAAAGSLTALPPAAFALTKQQIRVPFLRRVREDGAQFDVTVQELWEAPTTLTAIRAYVARTFKRSS